MARILAIGDIHGCLTEFQELIRLAGEVDYYVCLGDLVDRGPDTFGCIRFWDELKKSKPDSVLIRGNHDHKFVRFTEHSRIFQKTGKMGCRVPQYTWQQAPCPKTGYIISSGLVTKEGKMALSVLEDSQMYLQVFSKRGSNFIFIHGGIPADLTGERICRSAAPSGGGLDRSMRACYMFRVPFAMEKT